MPGALAALMPLAWSVAAKAVGRDTDRGLADAIRETLREWDSLVRGPYHGATRRTQTYLVMSHEQDSGRLELVDDRLRVIWPGAGTQPSFARIDSDLLEATRANGGTFVKNPVWRRLFGHDLITVHPLGGCVMADAANEGVVNERGQVFASAAGTATHKGLYVSDGALMPRSLGVNPLLTIAALAERCAALIARDRNWRIDYERVAAPLPEALARTIGVQFTETMRGHFSTAVTDGDFAVGSARGRADESSLEFTVTITVEDLDRFVADSALPVRIAGTITAPTLSPKPLTTTGGDFVLFTTDPDRVNGRLMIYRLPLTAADGAKYFLAGFKRIKDEPGLDAWADTTTLFVTLHSGASESAPVMGQGILRISVPDFARQLTTTRVLNAPSSGARVRALGRFGRHFGGVLFDTYGGLFARDSVFDPAAPPRKRRGLRVPEPEVHQFSTGDGVTLRLTRYQGGAKGPVLLSHGLGVSSLIFSIDTIETNLLEYLVGHGHDTWLLDYRASIVLPASQGQFGGDEIAVYDYPAALAKVRDVTGAADVQVVAHCFGSTTLFMAMLAGLRGVRSIVASQVATHIVGGAMTRLKTGLHLPELLDRLGVESLTAYVDAHADWQERLSSAVLKLYPVEFEERSRSPVDRRILFMYGLLYEHDQLNTATFDAVHEMFGVANDPDGRKRLYRRHVVPNYGHIDCIFGMNAVRDVYPHIVGHLETTR